MKIQFHIRGLNTNAHLRRVLEGSVQRLQACIPIGDVAVVLDRQIGATPPFRAFVQLAVPGPDIHAEARDHTLEAAWLKVLATLRRQIERRALQRQARQKRNGLLRAPASRRTRGAACLRG